MPCFHQLYAEMGSFNLIPGSYSVIFPAAFNDSGLPRPGVEKRPEHHGFPVGTSRMSWFYTFLHVLAVLTVFTLGLEQDLTGFTNRKQK